MNDYYEDEYYEDYEDDDPVIDARSYSCYLCKAKNGHLYYEEIFGWKYHGQDWGETVGQWERLVSRISELVEELQPVAIRVGRGLQPGECIECDLWHELWNEQADLTDDIPF